MSRVQFITANETDVFIQGAYFLWCLGTLQQRAVVGSPEYRCENDSYELTLKHAECITESLASKPVFIVDSEKEDWFRFQGLVKQWRNERGARSSITETAMMPAYQVIIGMGERAIRLIIAQLRSEGDEPDQWFWALRAITGENPVKPDLQGNFRSMAHAWFEWAEREGHAW